MAWTIGILFMVLALCFIIRMPVSLAMLSASIVYFVASGRDLGQVFTVITGNMFANYTMLLYLFLWRI